MLPAIDPPSPSLSPSSQTNTLETIQGDQYEYINYSPSNLEPYMSDLPAAQASKLISVMTDLHSNIEMDIGKDQSKVGHFDFNLINNEDSDSNSSNSGKSNKMECYIQAVLA